MRINADLARPAFADTSIMPWAASPSPGVLRKMLDRIGDEVARATSLVRFEPGCSFPFHIHGAGEEFFVIEGVFSDEAGDYPAGSYVRHPPGSSHQPYSQSGCILFVKLRQMDASDSSVVVVNTKEEQFKEIEDGLQEIFLYENPQTNERVSLLRAPGLVEMHREMNPGGAEWFVLEGSFEDENGVHGAGAWLRLPSGSTQTLRSRSGFCAWRKRGHLLIKPSSSVE